MLPLKSARVTNVYGVKDSQYSKGYHTGIDLASTETAVYATLSGTIKEVKVASGKGADPGGWGNYIILSVEKGEYDIIHAHLSRAQVAKGQTVKEGTILGITGSTGNATGPHLHFEVRKAPWGNRNEINPAVFLGIKNKEGAVESVDSNNDGEMKDMFKNLVLCNPGVDERAASYLADFLQAPKGYLSNSNKELIKCAEHIYVIGSKEKVTANSVNIVGTDRYDTCRLVLDLCQGKKGG